MCVYSLIMRQLGILCLILFVNISILKCENSYCFQFTWLATLTDKKNLSNLNCNELINEANDLPCIMPLVATNNDNVPDTVDLWRKYKNETFVQQMSPGEACVKYTYMFNKGVQNITYLSAKVNATPGCYRQHYISGLDVELCVCHSQLGQMPCNYGISIYDFFKRSWYSIFIVFLLLILYVN